MRALVTALLVLQSSAGVCVAPAMAADQAAPQDVVVVLSDDRFSPDHLVFRRGTAYRLLLENRGKELHEFTAPAFFRAVTLGTPEVLAPGGDVVLRAGERKVVQFVPLAAGRYTLVCADHDWAGMTGEIVIE